MRSRTGARTGWRAILTRLLAVLVLLTALLPCVEAGGQLDPAASAMTAAATDRQAGDPTNPLSDPLGMPHAGAHCNCQLADRTGGPEAPGPTAAGTTEHRPTASRGHASRAAEPPSRPPQA
ncbi:MAG: hypothetical protein JWP04_406 [Belnapia sp.]|nr:hypothetical protein [Belnapia sp.]